MVNIVNGQENRVPIRVTSLIDYSGFSATLEVNGIEKSIPDISVKNPKVIFSADEVASFDGAAFGRLVVYNRKGEEHVAYKIYFSVVDNENEVQSFNAIRIVIVSRFDSDVAGSSTDEQISRKVEEVVDAIIDDKVEESVSGIIDPKVEQAVDAVIDDKVEKVVNEIFDSSDSGTIGGVISDLQEKVTDDLDPRLTIVEKDVNENLKPRMEAAEDTLAKKVSLDYDDSDDNILFFEGRNEDSDSE